MSASEHEPNEPKRIDVNDLPLMQNVGKHPGARWSLWKEMADQLPEGIRISRDDAWTHEWKPLVIKRIVERRLAGVPVRTPRTITKHPTLALEGAPDLICHRASRYGPGPGIALVETPDRAAWRGVWERRRPTPVVPADVRLRMEGLFLLAPKIRWGLVIPVIQGDPYPQAPMLVEPDPELRDTLTAALDAWMQSIERGDAPEPDERGDREVLIALAGLAPRVEQAREIEGAEKEELHDRLEACLTARETLAQAQAAVREAREAYRQAVAPLIAHLGTKGPARVGERLIYVRSRELPPRRPEERIVEVRIEGSPDEETHTLDWLGNAQRGEDTREASNAIVHDDPDDPNEPNEPHEKSEKRDT